MKQELAAEARASRTWMYSVSFSLLSFPAFRRASADDLTSTQIAGMVVLGVVCLLMILSTILETRGRRKAGLVTQVSAIVVIALSMALGLVGQEPVEKPLIHEEAAAPLAQVVPTTTATLNYPFLAALGGFEVVSLLLVFRLWRKPAMGLTARLFWSVALCTPVIGPLFYLFVSLQPDPNQEQLGGSVE